MRKKQTLMSRISTGRISHAPGSFKTRRNHNWQANGSRCARKVFIAGEALRALRGDDQLELRPSGWQISKHIDGTLVIVVLKMAFAQRTPRSGVIHHSYRGLQYLGHEYVKLLTESGYHISCSANGNPYDNAWTESSTKTLKYVEFYL